VYGGLGIGLALVRRLVEQHGGTVTAESAGAGRGSAFHVRLPLASPAPVAPPAATAAAPAAGRRALRVPVADDNADSAETLALLLQAEGHEPRTVHDGAEALRLARAWRPDAAILDIGMPGLNGREVAEALRRTPGLEGLLLLALTGWGSAEDRARSATSGFDLHLTKPVDPLQVLQALARLRPGVAAPATGA
jgi:CheY-like chemotaxis protein